MAQARTIGPGYPLGPGTNMIPQIGGNSGLGIIGEMNMLVPGMQGATNSAMSNIQSLLAGVESPAITQNANAVWGAGSGLGPGSEFLKNRAVDLYGQRGERRKQQGLQDLIALISGTTSPYAALRGQDITQRGQDISRLLGERGLDLQSSEQSSNDEYRRDQLTLQALGLMGNMI